MKAFFVGGITDNSELDLDGARAPARYPPEHTGSGVHRYRLHSTVERDGQPLAPSYSIVLHGLVGHPLMWPMSETNARALDR